MNGKKILYGVLSLLAVLILIAAIYINSLLPIITGYAAKNLCSAVFVSGRQAEEVESNDLYFSFIKYTRNYIDYKNKCVYSHFLWGKSKAIYREGFGSTLVREIPEETLWSQKYPMGTGPSYSRDTIMWPLGDIIPDSATGIDRKALDEITEKLISGNGYKGNAYAFLVLHKGIPVSEAYKPQFNRNTRFLSWSMAKSFTNALAGVMVRQGRLDINQPAGLPEWKDDGRSKITLNDLLQMQSGLDWNEDYGNRSDVTLMLYCKDDLAGFALEKPEKQKAGSFWNYSSGSANIASYIIRKRAGNDSVYYSFAYTELFNKTGMPDVIFEVDASGTWIGSSYLYATARDYARFGLLYRNDGVFNGQRILPEGWVEYSLSSASASSGDYGSCFWLNRSREMPSLPEDMYACEGHDGQRIFIMPTQDLIVVILGYSPKSRGGMDFEMLLKDVLATVE